MMVAQCLAAFLVCASIVCATTIARAEPPVVEFAQPPKPVVPAAPIETEPTTLEEYQTQMTDLKAALRTARNNQDDAAVVEVRMKTASLRLWAKQHLHRQDQGLWESGFVLLGLGGVTFVSGIVVLTVGAFSNCTPGFIFASCSGNGTMIIAGALMMGGGALLALASIPMIVSGNKKVLDTTPRASFVVGPLRAGISVSF